MLREHGLADEQGYGYGYDGPGLVGAFRFEDAPGGNFSNGCSWVKSGGGWLSI